MPLKAKIPETRLMGHATPKSDIMDIFQKDLTPRPRHAILGAEQARGLPRMKGKQND